MTDKILFCKIVHMKYYKGLDSIDSQDRPYGELHYIQPDIHTFSPKTRKDGKQTAFVRYGTLWSQSEYFALSNDIFDDVLVVYFTTNIKKENVIVGWYKHATVCSNLCRVTFNGSESSPLRYSGNRYILDYTIITDYENCVLLPEETRSLWKSPYIMNESYGYGFGQSKEWFTREEKIYDYIKTIVERINSYTGENWIDKYPD